MALLRFTKFIGKVLSHEKKRTIRKPRQCRCGASIVDYLKTNEIKDGETHYKRDKCICDIEVGEILHTYILLKIGEATVTNVKKLEYLMDLTDEDAKLDGFYDSSQGVRMLDKMHSTKKEKYYGPFNIIDFEPGWEKQMMAPLEGRLVDRVEKGVLEIRDYVKKSMVKRLTDQIGEHSGRICHYIDELRNTSGTGSRKAYHRIGELKGLISDENACIQEILVSFHDIFMDHAPDLQKMAEWVFNDDSDLPMISKTETTEDEK